MSLSLFSASLALASEKPSTPPPTSPPPPAELALNWKAEPEFGGFYAAVDILKKQNITLKIIEGGSGTPTIQMLAAKKVPFAVVSGDELVTARERGMNLIAIFTVYQTNPHGIMVREDSPWKNLDELLSDSKATVAVQLGQPYVSFLKKKYPTMKARLVPYQGGIAPFLAQKNFAQQCFISAEPLAAKKAGVPTRIFPVAETGFNPYLAVVAVHKDTLLEHRDFVQKLNAGFRAGWEQYIKSPSSTDQRMHQLNPSMSLDTFKESGLAQLSLIQHEGLAGEGSSQSSPLTSTPSPRPKSSEALRIGDMTLERWKSLSQQLKDLGLIKKTEDPKEYFINL